MLLSYGYYGNIFKELHISYPNYAVFFQINLCCVIVVIDVVASLLVRRLQVIGD